MTEEEYLGLVRDLVSEVMARILLRKPTASVILEKTPGHVYYWRDILKVFPQAYFLHIVRDPRAVVASLHAAREWGGGWPSSWITENCETWRTSVAQGRTIRDATPNYLEVRYEDLVQNGVLLLQHVFQWMGLDVGTSDCTSALEANSIEMLRSGAAANAPWQLSTEPSGFYRNGEVEGWRRELSAWQVRLIERLTGQTAAQFGYRMSANSVLDVNSLIVGSVLVVDRIRTALRWRARHLAGIAAS
jgi:hypothetical protein